ncbi:MAG TPA: 1-deoxy-D-xylulose-5-phosphate reductoisomerase [Flavobacteriales bacterium]|jgi:1-deoxy-D-xylulose-5-phosphate reductoisomerase|nr:1-deoxy-D-xylulose-5-phosphate reductoisomerase [Flavobacteriales bacterium]HHZ96102.1 1-deoxy-D-xylulose-5-phosphate reductoisomerase [Flavobacteriales bacterium]HIB77226.1 1-deoxy-D-xylulose-5-phosphate reductoisomerase [Flavobacteriales bacterium]HIN40922.1 1-deoxy-D-xylulose-5-phosphate reductoisomerase [Flavobacteriales bacterium]HIO16618.1 1-deoxy-D-xylulose-5-phosphate reductoisomerase [Flavobacteriales bacterium]
MSSETPTRGIAILGSTGSIGTQALDVIREQSDFLHVEVLSAGRNANLLIKQALEFKPNAVVIAEPTLRDKVFDALFDKGIKVYAGHEALVQVVEMEGIDMVLTALVGAAGLRPTLSAIRAGKHIALANKETMVVAGELVTAEALKAGVDIHPVDSEHSAIYQCLAGEFHNDLEKIILTASGGPFRGYTSDMLATVTKAQALKHPNWDMGAKITIDSASMMNKGLEVIEAKWLFDLKPDAIDIIVHPQSIIHSIAQFEDGSMKAQMGLPDMKLPIQYALTYPRRLANTFPRFNFLDYPSLTFEAPNFKAFRNLGLAFDALAKEGNAPAILNAANEIAVARFLNDEIAFAQLPDVVEHALSQVSFQSTPDLKDLLASDSEARALAQEF